MPQAHSRTEQFDAILVSLETHLATANVTAADIRRIKQVIARAESAKQDIGYSLQQTPVAVPVEILNDFTRLGLPNRPFEFVNAYIDVVRRSLAVLCPDPILRRILLQAYVSATDNNVISYADGQAILTDELGAARKVTDDWSRVHLMAKLDRLLSHNRALQQLFLNRAQYPDSNVQLNFTVPSSLQLTESVRTALQEALNQFMDKTAFSVINAAIGGQQLTIAFSVKSPADGFTINLTVRPNGVIAQA